MARPGCVEGELAYTTTTNGMSKDISLEVPPYLVLLSNAQQLIIKTFFAHRHFSNSSHPDGLVVSNAHKIDGVDTFGSFSGVLLTWTMQGESVFETAVPSTALDVIILHSEATDSFILKSD